MQITQEQAFNIQNLRHSSKVLTTNDETNAFAEIMLFNDGSIVYLEGEMRRAGSPGEINQVLIKSANCMVRNPSEFQDVDQDLYERLVAAHG